MAHTEDIDDSLYSRQRYVLGDGAMHKLAKANVLIIGLGGVGVEVAKNVVLAGVKSVTLFDTKICSVDDLGTQFFLRQQDVDSKLTRALACCERLAELNPYVTVQVLDANHLNDLSVLSGFQCVVASDMMFSAQIQINAFCRSQSPPIPFVSCDVYGLFSYLFCDFGDQFVVHDSDGEESKEIFIGSIKQGTHTAIETLDYIRHGLESGDKVTFKEIKGMTKLNGQIFTATDVNPSTFSIDLDSTGDGYQSYLHGGVFKRIKEPTKMHFESLDAQTKQPDILVNDLSKLDSPPQCFIGIISLHVCMKNGIKTEEIAGQSDTFLKTCENINKERQFPLEKLDTELLRTLAQTCSGKLAPLCASIGGMAAQEVLKGLSSKFTPLKQWLLLDAVELYDQSNRSTITDSQLEVNTRYAQLSRCLSRDLVEKLHNTKLFMVGCGAIGCEMLKNYALLGIGSGGGGLITITDNDLIEKSNLNRQFLFRPWHVQKSKAVTASQAVREINPGLNIEAQQNKVCTETQEKIYNDKFFQRHHVVVNALDNLEARRYVDGRCVSNQKPLVETGTMGTKGHVQVVAPFLTESYSDQRDPVDEDVPYCTLKSFPQVVEHTIQWARDKFESLFNLKPTNFNKFWQTNGSPEVFKKTLGADGVVPDGFVDSVSLLKNTPTTFKDCVALARVKFELYFNHKARLLLHVFPLDTAQNDGSLFWQSPKRPPNPVTFSGDNDTHMQFIESFARLKAKVNGIKIENEETKRKNLLKMLNEIDVPEFRPSSKKIETDESQSGSSSTSEPDLDKISQLTAFVSNCTLPQIRNLSPEHFEKDDDSNSHIDFITSASNIRAAMYNIETADRYKTKRIAGRIIPAIATTTAAIAGLASLELIKVIARQPLENLKNCFLNLALPMMILSEPGAPVKTKVRDGLEFSIWDRWDVHGNKDFKLLDFIQYFKNKYGLQISMVCEGVRMIYMPVMPGHKKRVKDTMVKLLKPSSNTEYSDVIISFEPMDGPDEDDLPAPPVRYFYHL